MRINDVKEGVVVNKPYSFFIPAECLTGDDLHDAAVVMTICAAYGKVDVKTVEKTADRIFAVRPSLLPVIADTCRKIAESDAGEVYHAS